MVTVSWKVCMDSVLQDFFGTLYFSLKTEHSVFWQQWHLNMKNGVTGSHQCGQEKNQNLTTSSLYIETPNTQMLRLVHIGTFQIN